MDRFDKFMEVVFKNEGYYSNDKYDKGGETKYGISKRAYPHLDIANLTKKDAEKIYYEDYYKRSKADQVNDDLTSMHLFDMAVNAGVRAAVKLLQKSLGVSVDGIIGKNTLAAVNSNFCCCKFIEARKEYYKIISTGSNSRYLKGWLNRVDNTTKAII